MTNFIFCAIALVTLLAIVALLWGLGKTLALYVRAELRERER